MRRRVAVVGAGMAGLSLAAALDPARFAVALYEADPSRAGAGAALGLWPSARRALSSLGVRDLGAPAEGGALFSVSGRRVAGLGSGGPRMVLRPELLSALSAAVPSEVRRCDEEVSEPAALDADLVVGADGVRSRVRALVQPDVAERRATPFVALRGLIEEPVDPALVGEYWGRGRMFGLVPVRAGLHYWFTAHRSTIGPEPLDPAEVVADARRAFDGDAQIITRTLRVAEPGTLATRLWVTPPMRRYVRDRYVVVGDAAHATVPNLGRGAADAIVDGVSLARVLNGGGDLRAWQVRRVSFTQATRVGALCVMRFATGIAPRS